MNSGAVRITVICDECIRIEHAPGADGRFVDAPSLFAIHGPSGRHEHGAAAREVITTPVDPRSAGHPERFGVPIVVRTPRVTLSYTPDGHPPGPRNTFALIEHPCPPAVVPKRDGRVVWTPGMSNQFNLGGTLSTLDGLRGAVPLSEGLLARDGWHLIDDSSRHLLVDDWAMSREHYGAAGNTDWYLFAYGADYASAFRALATIAGEVPLPRRYALGSWFSRYWPYTSAEFRGIVEEYHAHGFPLDVMVLDMDWHRSGWTGWSWNRELLPDAEELIDWLHSQDLAVTLNLHPADGVGPHEDRYADFMRAIGREPDGSTVRFDAGDRTYMRALFDQVHRPLESRDPEHGRGAGVDFWWLDWQQDRIVRSMPGLTNLRWLNHLYTRHTARAPGTLGPDDPGLRPLSFSRWAGDVETDDPGWGDHRHPVHFSGDAHTGWPMLAFQVHFTLTAGNVGCFFWSHDIGGHFGPRFEEATARWVQFGALSPVLRLHSARSETLDRRPWTYQEKFAQSMRAAFRLRAELMPTIYSAAVESCRDTLPLLRPMYLADPTRERAYLTPQQYTLGRDLLCAPIVTPGLGEQCVSTQAVWFPPGPGEHDAWHDLATGERFQGGSEAVVACGIDGVPVFVRSGVPVATRPFTQRMASEPLDELVVRLFPGRPGQVASADLYEDDGVSLDYTLGRRARTPITAAWSEDDVGLVLDLSVGPTVGEFRGQPPERAVTLRLHAVQPRCTMLSSVKGHASTPSFDPDCSGGTLEIRLPAASIRVERTTRVRVAPAEPASEAVQRRAYLFGLATGTQGDARDLPGHLGRAVHAPATEPRLTEQLLAIGAGIGVVPVNHELRLIDTYGWLEPGSVRATLVDTLGAAETPLGEQALVLDGGGALRSRAANIDLPPLDRPLRPPPIGLRAARIARIRARMHGEPIGFDHIVESRLTPVTQFMAAGPFDWDWRWSIVERAHEPELDADALRPGAAWTGQNGEPVRWVRAACGDKWGVDLRATFPGKGGLGYAITTIRSPRAQRARLFVECSDKLEMFINGARIHSLDAFDSHAAALGYADAELREGDNRLLVKLSEGGGGWGFTLRIEAETALSAHE